MAGIPKRKRLEKQLLDLWDRSPPEERGRLIAVMWGHAVAVLIVDVSAAVCLTRSARRIWRGREHGWVRATVDGGQWKALGLLALVAAARRPVMTRVIAHLDTPPDQAG